LIERVGVNVPIVVIVDVFNIDVEGTIIVVCSELLFESASPVTDWLN